MEIYFLERKKLLEKLNWIIDRAVNLGTPQTKFAVFKVILKVLVLVLRQ